MRPTPTTSAARWSWALDPISEKPLCTHAEQAQRIVDVQKRTGRRLDVTFNARHEASAMKVKELLLAGEIGDLYSVGYEEFLDLDHGASYFRRWHGLKQASGTLLCHKASHHFDQLNWWIGAEPVEVTAHGRLNKYGVNGPFRHANCRLCPHKQRCDLHWDITTSKQLVELYVDCEDQDGYYRDGCLYRREINIPDTYSVQITYANRVLVTYSLNATAPYEGQSIVFNGSKGRIDVRNFNRQPWKVPHESEIRLTRNFKDSTVITVDPAARGAVRARRRRPADQADGVRPLRCRTRCSSARGSRRASSARQSGSPATPASTPAARCGSTRW